MGVIEHRESLKIAILLRYKKNIKQKEQEILKDFGATTNAYNIRNKKIEDYQRKKK